MRLWVAGFAAVLAIGLAGCTQQDDPNVRKEIALDIDTTLLTAYRPGSWVPIDVVVRNTLRDFEGVVELTIREPQGELIEAMYMQAPIQSARGSRKRVRLHVPLQRGILEAIVRDSRGRRLTPFPAKFEPQPVLPKDFMPLLLDEDPDAFGFLYDAMQRMAPQTRMHRVFLSGDDIALLPGRSEVLDAYDLIVLGEIEPRQLAEAQRQALAAFASGGGVVVACLGENAPRYRDSWLAGLAGVAIGGQQTVDEAELAEGFFGPNERTGAAPGRPVVTTAMKPLRAGLRIWGKTGLPLAVLAPYGQGHIVFVAVDPKTNALRRCTGFLRFWAELRKLRVRSGELRLDTASYQIADVLPEATGIRVFPRSFVIGYLGAYVLVGVLGNWLFWSWAKRREWAWVCLIFFSAGFTAFAVIYGTAGRAQETELHTFECLRVDAQGVAPRVQALAGVLTAGTSRYEFAVDAPGTSVQPAEAPEMQIGPGNRKTQFGGSRPFRWLSGPPDRISGFAVGASELRMLAASHAIELPGAVESSLVYNGERIEGELRNMTGLEIEKPMLYFAGSLYGLELGAGGTYRIGQVHAQEEAAFRRNLDPLLSSDPLHDAFLSGLLGDPLQNRAALSGLTPKLAGWVSSVGSPGLALQMTPPPAAQNTLRFLVADVAVDYRSTLEQAPLEFEVSLLPGNGHEEMHVVQPTPTSANYRKGRAAWASYTSPIYFNDRDVRRIEIRPAVRTVSADIRALRINLIQSGGEMPTLLMDSGGEAASDPPGVPEAGNAGSSLPAGVHGALQPENEEPGVWKGDNEFRVDTYRFPDPSVLFDPRENVWRLRLSPKSLHHQLYVQALAELKPTQPYADDWQIYTPEASEPEEAAP